jgi:AraC-like DNA-binding protein
MKKQNSISCSVKESFRNYKTNLPVSYVYCAQESVGKKRIIPEFEIIIVLEGSGFFEIEDNCYKMEPFTLNIFPPNKFVYYESNGAWKILSLYIEACHEEKIRLLNLHNCPNTKIEKKEKCSAIIKEILTLVKSPFKAKNIELIDVYCEALLLNASPGIRVSNKQGQSAIDRIFLYINEHYETRIQIDLLCRKFGISRSLFFKEWHQKVQISPNEYITSLKIRRAASLLSSTDMRINEIANQLSFSEPQYFSRRFKHFYKCSPRKYRDIFKRSK